MTAESSPKRIIGPARQAEGERLTPGPFKRHVPFSWYRGVVDSSDN